MRFEFDATKIQRVENITLFTDASYAEYPSFGYKPTAGGAFWAKGGSDGRVQQSGRFQIENAESSTDAEVLAALMSIGFLLENPDFHHYFSMGKFCRLILVSDCTAVEKILMEQTNRSMLRKHHVVTELIRIKSAINTLGIQFKVNWVKAHNNDGSERTWVNKFCDKHAKIARLDQVKSRVTNELHQTYLDLTQKD